MKKEILYSVFMIYSCAQLSRVNEPSLTMNDICPKLENGMMIELKKGFNENSDDFRETYMLKTYKQHIEFKITSEMYENYIRFNPIKKEIEYGGLSEEKKTHKGVTLSGKTMEYNNKLNEFIEGIKLFDNSRWMYVNLDDVIECVERNGFSEQK